MIYRFKNGDEQPIVTQASIVSPEQASFMRWQEGKYDRKVLDSKKDIIAISAEDFINLESDEDFARLRDAIVSTATMLASQGHEIGVVVDGCATHKDVGDGDRIEYSFDQKQMKRLDQLNSKLFAKCGKTLHFNEFFQVSKYSDLKKSWSLLNIMHANREIDTIVENIKEMKLSPYETMAYIYKYLAENFSTDSGRFFPYVLPAKLFLSEPSIVEAAKKHRVNYVGLCSMTKAIVDRLNDSRLKCESKIIVTKDGKRNWRDSLNMIKIDDLKYGIKGQYMLDSRAGSRNKVPLKSLGKSKNFAIDYSEFMYPAADGEGRKVLSKREAATRIGAIKNGKFIPLKDMEGQGERIPFGTLEKALTEVYTKEHLKASGKEQINSEMEDKIHEEVQLDMAHTKTAFAKTRKPSKTDERV